MTTLGLCAPVENPLGPGLGAELKRHGWQRIRVDLHFGPEAADHAQATAQLREFVHVPSAPLPTFLLAHGTMELWPNADVLTGHVKDTCVKMQDLGLFAVSPPMIEIGNEPDLARAPWKSNPEDLAKAFAECYGIIREFSSSARVLTPSVSNLNVRGIDYLNRMYLARYDDGALVIPAGAECAIHRYPHDGDPDKPHEKFRSRDREVERMKEIIGDRPFHVTETGFANYMYKGRFTSDVRVANIFERELAFWTRHGAASVFWYQINDGRYQNEADDDELRLATYGIRSVSGVWKPIVERVKRLRGTAS